jgi:MFS family permease
LSVVLGLYLDAIGLDTTGIGWIFTAAIAGGAVMTVVLTAVADSFGRRTLLVVGAILMALAGLVFVATNNPVLLAVAAIFGTISPSGKEVGPFLSIEQAILPQTTGDQNRTTVFSAYNLVGSLAGALGALAVDVPTRQSYTMAVVDPGERAAAAGIMSVARNTGAAVAPLFTSAILATPSLGLPFLLAGGLKIIYDVWIFAVFRHVRPPEEVVGRNS